MDTRSQAKLRTKFSRANYPAHGQSQSPDGQQFYAGTLALARAGWLLSGTSWQGQSFHLVFANHQAALHGRQQNQVATHCQYGVEAGRLETISNNVRNGYSRSRITLALSLRCNAAIPEIKLESWILASELATLRAPMGSKTFHANCFWCLRQQRLCLSVN